MDELNFLDMSSALTGFDPFDLRATSQLTIYCDLIRENVDEKTLDEIAAAWRRVKGLPPDERDPVIALLVADKAIGTPLKRIVMLWYTGSWYVEPPYEYNTVSGQSYVQGLMWKAVGAHPMAAAPQGYGAWALPPPVEGA